MEEKTEAAPVRRRQTLIGVVTSAKMRKTVVVTVERLTSHPVYTRSLRRSKSYMAHDERGECREGDRVLMVESRPMSRHKRWRIRRVLKKAHGE